MQTRMPNRRRNPRMTAGHRLTKLSSSSVFSNQFEKSVSAVQLEKTNMAAVQHYDAAIIGAGQAGVPLARALAQSGWKTALIEREHVGGTCINVGCTPTKTMVASARVAHLARRAADYGVHTSAVSVDMAKVRQRKRDIVNSFRSGSQSRVEQTPNLDLIFGEAQFVGPKTVEVGLMSGGTRQLTAETIVINTGCRPALPPVPGLDSVP